MASMMNHWNAQAIVLAAGKATRFKTKKTKLTKTNNKSTELNPTKQTNKTQK